MRSYPDVSAFRPHFHNEAAAYKFVEARIWPNGAVCPHCGGTDRNSLMGGKSTRIGTYKCYDCRKPFTVKVGTIFEASHVKLNLWLQAIFLIASSKKGVSSNQLHRTLGVTLKTAWFMSHRIREAMRSGNLAPLGGNGQIVEVDETYFGQRKDKRTTKTSGEPFIKQGKSGPSNKRAVLGLVERNGSARLFHVASATKDNVAKIVLENVALESMLFTDESRLYPTVGAKFLDHMTVKHSAGEYVRGGVHTNTIESVFSVFKRGMHGVYQHCAEKHLNRYLSEFDFRHNHRIALGVNDIARADTILTGVVGKRLTYRTTSAG